MHSDLVQFDPHFLVEYKDSLSQVEIYNGRTGQVEGKLPLPEFGRDNAPDSLLKTIISLSAGWIVFQYVSDAYSLDEKVFGPYAWNPRSNPKPKLKDLKELEGIRRLGSFVETHDRVILFYGSKAFVYNRSWDLVKEKELSPGSITFVNFCLLLNPSTVIISTTDERILKVSIPDLNVEGVVDVNVPMNHIRKLARVSDSLFLTGHYREVITLWNSDLKSVKEFKIGERMIDDLQVLDQQGGFTTNGAKGKQIPGAKVYISTSKGKVTLRGYQSDFTLSVFSLSLPEGKEVQPTRSFGAITDEGVMFSFQSIYIPETQEVIYVKQSQLRDMDPFFTSGSGREDEKGIFAFNLRTLAVKKVGGVPEDFQRLEYVKWLSKADFEQGLTRMKSLWEGKVPVPTDILRVITGFLA